MSNQEETSDASPTVEAVGECWYRMNPEIFIKSPDMFRAELLKNNGITS